MSQIVEARKVHNKALNRAMERLLEMQETCIERLKKVDGHAATKLSEGFKSPYGTSLADLYVSRALKNNKSFEEATEEGLKIFFTKKKISTKIKEICFEGGFPNDRIDCEG